MCADRPEWRFFPLIQVTLMSKTSRAPAHPAVRRPWLKWTLSIVGLVLLGLLIKFILHLLLPRNFAGSGEKIVLQLAGGPFEVLYYCGHAEPKGIVLLGTGDGGWSYWEENTARHLIDNGYAVAGWDCRKFADSRTYRHPELVRGFTEAVEAVRDRSHADDEVPVWYGGWSTGAEQSVAAAASPDRPETLVGLLLAAPGARSRYGLTTADLLGKTPTGPDTFALKDFAPALEGVKVVQFVAGLDPMDDEEWLTALKSPPLKIPLPGKLHDMGGAGPEFQKAMDAGMAWTLVQTF